MENYHRILSCFMKMRRNRPVTAKTYDGTSWSSTQSKVSKAQKTKGLLNVFGVYDHINNKMLTHGYKSKTGKQFLDCISRVDYQKYDSGIKQIFLDNASIHSQVKQQGKRDDIKVPSKNNSFVFLPTRS